MSESVLVYPNGVNVQPPPQTVSHSKGSFGVSFIVLAVIIVISLAACVLSRLLNKKGQKKHKEPKKDKNHKQNKGQDGRGPTYPMHPTFPPQQSRRKEMDMEFGYGARVAPGPGPGPGFPKQAKGSDIEFGFDKKSRQPTKGGSDIEMGFDRRVPSGKVAPNVDMMRGQRPMPYPNGAMNHHLNGGGRWAGQ